MDCDGWHKSMSHFTSMCCSSPLNTQVLFYDGHDRHFYDRALDILSRHNIQYFILKAGDYLHDQPNHNGPNMRLNNLYCNASMNWMRHYGTVKFTPPHMNYFLIEIREALKLSSATTTQKNFKVKYDCLYLLWDYISSIYTNNLDVIFGRTKAWTKKIHKLVRVNG